jgi:hypothetical protein
MFVNAVVEQLQKYLVDRDFEALEQATRLIQAEHASPSLQEVVLSVTLTVAEITAQIAAANSLKLASDSFAPGLVDLPQEDMLVRLHASDQEEGSAIVMLVVAVTPSVVVLAPVMSV